MAERKPENPDEPIVQEEEDAAAAEAAEIGGEGGLEDLDPAERASAEHGGGVAEGFEQAEEMHENHASHEEPGGSPLGLEGDPEDARTGADYAEADEVESTETDDDTQGTSGDIDRSADSGP
jgi:hypothetical protein